MVARVVRTTCGTPALTAAARVRVLAAVLAAAAALVAVPVLGAGPGAASVVPRQGAATGPGADGVSVATDEPYRVLPGRRLVPLPEPPVLPGGGRRVFADGRFLVAYYGTAGTDALGVLGEGSPDAVVRRLRDAARPFARPGRPVQPVFELIATVAHASPGADGDFNGDLPREAVQRYLDAAHRHGVMVVLDLQPGRSDFLTVAKRWEWALRDPWVGLALDPEWRMGPQEVPGRTIGSVDAAEVNAVSAWLDDLTARDRLPQKPLVLHQFRDSMIRDPGAIRDRRHLAEIQHVDGFGTPGQKVGTYRRVARPDQFAMGFKLFYDEDVDLMAAAQVHRVRPAVRFVSYQ